MRKKINPETGEVILTPQEKHELQVEGVIYYAEQAQDEIDEALAVVDEALDEVDEVLDEMDDTLDEADEALYDAIVEENEAYERELHQE